MSLVEPPPAPHAPEVRVDVHPRPPTRRAEEPQGWQPSNLVLRCLTAVLLVPPVLWVCWVGGLPYVLGVVLFSVLGINEFYGFISAKGGRPNRWLGAIAVALLPLIVYYGDPFLATNFLTAVLLTVMVLQLAKREIREAMISVSATFFGVFYVGWLLSHAISVRFISSHLERRYAGASGLGFSEDLGIFFMIFCLAAAVVSDSGAFFAGRRYGRHKLMPMISPNKTVEGAVGGILSGALACLAVKLVFDHLIAGDLARDLSYVRAIVFGVILSVASILGDLVESLLKRDAELKDAGVLLPGVGGVLDRVDSALLAIPVMYYLLLAHYYSLYGA